MREHRVPLRGGSLRRRRHPDPDRSADPRVQAVLAGLRAAPAPSPRAHFRAELRAQLVAVAPRIVAEGEPTLATRPTTEPAAADPGSVRAAGRPTPGATRRRDAASRGARNGSAHGARHGDGVLAGHGLAAALARPLKISAAALLVLALALGGAVWLSRGSLPGDALYGLKRASENLQLATASGPTDKAHDYLGFAGTRVGEVQDLLDQSSTSSLGRGPSAAGAVDAHTAKLVTDTLGAADSDVRSAAALLGKQAVSTRSATPLAVLTTWAPAQLARLQTVAGRLPGGSLKQRIVASEAVVQTANSRASALERTAPCGSQHGADEFGPIPGAACSAQNTPSTSAPPLPGTASTRGAPRAHTPRVSAPKNSGHAGGSGLTGSIGGGSSTSPAAPRLPITSAPKLPITGGSCGISASLGGAGVGVGVCTPGVQVSTPTVK
ncbi:DUF5667 domain-containing protein [uncultured Jatrophihabitans sp.]|uniref:DUF5667 domain-containing protein n=1 Tax=uncultured Jatrophihabitans sp. TaxID=1610747 RepID=UPI0035CC6552